MRGFCNYLKNGSSGVALAVALAAGASPAFAQEQGVETVVVSASRISIAGYQQPTPVTVLDARSLEQEAKADIGDAIRQLPAVSGGSPQSGSNAITISGAPAGQSNLSLRGLGTLRTLVLVDGQRVVQSNITGGVDLNTIPSSLVQRVDVVTGGASAAWGSDAVAGVVNLVLNKNFTGLKANAEFSDNSSDLYRTFKAEASYGTSFDGDRGHLILSGSFVNSPDTVYSGQNEWYSKTQLVPNPAYNATTNSGVPQLIRVGNIGQSTATPGGLIVSNPAGTTPGSANLLRNLMFTGPNAAVTRINPGNIVGPAAWGGDLNYYTSQTPITQTAIPYRSTTLFAYGSYKLSDTVRASVQLNYGKSFSQNSGQAAMRLGNLVIQSDNPYIPQTVRDLMTANGIPSFTMGTLNTNNVDLRNLNPRIASTSLGIPVNNNHRQQMRGVFTLDGTLGSDWSWNAYYQHGITKVALRVLANTLTGRVTQAADAVRVTPGNVGASGLAVGSIACRSTLSAPGNGCLPLNVFGEGVASPETIAWINSYNDIDDEDITLNEDVAAASMQGVLPWGLPAGKVAVAFGAEYRKEGGRTVADPRANAAQWASGNFANFAGQYHVEEGFLQVDVPVLKDSVVQSLDVSAAGRLTSYSTSGTVETWKLGATSELNEDIRLRVTWSTDIRAPNLSELFSTHQINTGAQIDLNSPACTAPIGANGFPTSTAGCASPFVLNDRGGNTLLQPEVASTITGGIVFTPSFIEGLQVALDWYDISIKKSIVTLGGDPIQCAAQVQAYCNLLVFGGPAYPANGKPSLSTVQSLPVNAAFERTSGMDAQIDYLMPFWNGDLLWHFVANYNDQHTIVNGGVTCNSAGVAGINLPAGCAGNNGFNPKFRGTLSAGYTEGPISATIQTRFSSAFRLNNLWVAGRDVDDNSVPWSAYLDLRGSYQVDDNFQVYGAVDNILGNPPLLVPPLASGGSSYQSLGAVGDTLGRVLRVGVRFQAE